MTITMGSAEREAFLAGVHVGVLSVEDPSHGPFSVPVWYAYEPGGSVDFITRRGSTKAGLLRAAGRCSLCAQSEIPPYGFVSVEGPVSWGEDPSDPEALRALASRYLGPDGGEAFMAATAGDAPNNVMFRLAPERWRTADFSKESL
jgi:nitroimidazol reductase NimA-like FMN-containing flavoprotein (pyridoxamine 5'-phosphate oxidase superfamily)